MNGPKRKTVYLMVDGLPETQRPAAAEDVEVFTLTEANAHEALEKIFAADAVSVWGEVKQG